MAYSDKLMWERDRDWDQIGSLYILLNFTLQLMWELYTLALYQSRSRSHISSI